MLLRLHMPLSRRPRWNPWHRARTRCEAALRRRTIARCGVMRHQQIQHQQARRRQAWRRQARRRKAPQITLIRRRGRAHSAHNRRRPRMMTNGHEVRMRRRSRLRLRHNSLSRNSLSPGSLNLCSRRQRNPHQHRRKVLLSSRPNPSRFPRCRSNPCQRSQSSSRKPNNLSKLRRSRNPRRPRRSRPQVSGRRLKRRRICHRDSIWHRLPRWIRRFW